MARALGKPTNIRQYARTRKNAGPVEPETGTPGYDTHFHEAASGYLVLSSDGTILDANKKMALWTGHRRQKLLGANIVDLMPVGDQVLFASYVVPQLAVAGHFDELAVDLLSTGGKSIPVLLSAARSEHDGVPIDRITVFRASQRRLYEHDLVEALRKAEAAETAYAAAEEDLREKLQALEEKDRVLQENLAESIRGKTLLDTVLNAADVGLLVVDTQGNTVLANTHLLSGWQEIMGDVPVTSGSGKVFSSDRVTPLPEAETPVRRAAAGEAFSDELFWFGTGADQMAINVSARPIEANAALSGSVIAFTDISGPVQALAAQQEHMARMTQDLRTPLTAIMGYLDLALKDSRLPAHLTGPLGIAMRNSERLLQVVSRLLEVVPESVETQPRPVNLAEVVRTGIVSVRPKATAKKLDFLTEIPVSLVADADSESLTKMVDGLLANAVKYSPPEATVCVQLWQQGQALCLRVADDASGMSEAGPEKAPTKFLRGRRGPSSAGAGLESSKSAVEELGGELSFISTEGEGNVITVTLPIRAETAALNR